MRSSNWVVILILSFLIIFTTNCLAQVTTGVPEPSPGDQMGTLTVKALSDLGKNLEDAEVTCFRIIDSCSSQEYDLSPIAPGTFSSQVPVGTYRVRVQAPARADGGEDKILVEAGKETLVEYHLSPGEIIYGRVLGPDGFGREGVNVRCCSEKNYSQSWDVVSNSDGTFLFNQLSHGLYSLKTEAAGLIKHTKNNVPAGTDNLLIKLRLSYAIKGKVVSEGTPDFSQLKIDCRNPSFHLGLQEVSSEDDGQFIVSGLEAGNYDIRATTPELTSPWIRDLEALPLDQAPSILVTLSPGASISGQVYRSASKEPLKKAEIKLMTGEKRIGSKYTDKEGKYKFFALEPGKYQLRVELNNDPYGTEREKKSLVLAPGQEKTGIDFALEVEPGPSFSGLVTDLEGQPVSGVKLAGNLRTGPKDRLARKFYRLAETGEDGSFSFTLESSQEGEFQLEAQAQGYALARSQWFPLVKDQTDYPGITLELSPGVSLNLEVVDGEGSPLASALARISPVSQPGQPHSYLRDNQKAIDTQGRARFEHLAPGSYRLQVSLSGYAPGSEEVEIAPDDDRKEVTIKLEPGRSLRVLVQEESGEAVPGVRISIHDSGALGNFMNNVTDASGFCLIPDLPLDRFKVLIITPDPRKFLWRTVAPGEEELVVILKTSGSLQGRLVSPDREPVLGISLDLRRLGEDIFDQLFDRSLFSHEEIDQGEGFFRRRGLQPAEYEIVLSAPGFARKVIEKVEIFPNQITDLGEIVLEVGGKVTGKVVSVSGSIPLGRVSVKLYEDGNSDESVFVAGLSDYSGSDGTYEIESVPRGTYTLRARSSEYRRYKRAGIWVSGGQEIKLAPIRLEKLTVQELEEARHKKGFIPSLGFHLDHERMKEGFLGGFPVGEVSPGSCAEQVGLRKGDVILLVNGKGMLEDTGSYYKGLLNRPGTPIKLKVKRKDGSEEELEGEIGDWDYEKKLKELLGY